MELQKKGLIDKMRLIDADWVLEHIKPYELSDEDWSVTGGTAIRLIHNAIDNAPTVDAVPVVRCRECKHRGTDDCIFHIKGEPADEELLLKLDNDFCSYGERKEGADNS